MIDQSHCRSRHDISQEIKLREALAPAYALLTKLPCIKEFCSYETANALLTKLPHIKEFCYHDVVDYTLDVVHA
jgi:hypothetical protein